MTQAKRASLWWGIVLMACAAGCDGRRSSAADCQAIFDRIVHIELREMGFRDAALERLRTTELGAKYRGDIAACVGHRLSGEALRCARSARSTEVLSHFCLR